MARPQQPNQDREDRAVSWQDITDTFRSASFMGFLNRKSVKFSSDGSLVFEIAVPAGQVDRALDIRLLVRQNVPLDITLETSSSYLAHRQEQEANRLRAVDGTTAS